MRHEGGGREIDNRPDGAAARTGGIALSDSRWPRRYEAVWAAVGASGGAGDVGLAVGAGAVAEGTPGQSRALSWANRVGRLPFVGIITGAPRAQPPRRERFGCAARRR